MQVRGSRSHLSKVDEEDVKLIKELIKEKRHHEAELEKLKWSVIGEKFGLSGQAVRNMAYGQTWRHVD